MDNIKNIEETERCENLVKDLFKELVTEEEYDTWADSFTIDEINEKQIVVSYRGNLSYKKFKKECKESLISCIYSVMGSSKKVKILKSRNKKSENTSLKKQLKAAKFFIVGMIFVCFATAVIVVMCNYIGNRDFRETFYNVSSIKVDNNTRVVLLSDLHKSSYGEKNEKLLERTRELNPDVIVLAGDIVNSSKDDADYALDLSKKLAEIAPAYYIYGNNEVETIYDFPLNESELDKKFGFNKDNRDETALLNLEDSFEKKLEETGIKVLKNEKDTIKINNISVDIYGVLTSNPSSFWSYSEKSFSNYISENKNNLKITVVHEPFIFEEFEPEYWGDLMLCGHTHGGIMRIPVIGPLYTHEGGLLPERGGRFVYGRYDAAGKPLIVSSGLENKTLLRINNQPELVVVDINKF